MSWYFRALKKYAVSQGRAHRKEYWMFILFHWIVYLGLAFIEGFLGLFSYSGGDPILPNIYLLGVLIPLISAGVRRLHDTDRSGWWIIVPFVNLFFLCIDGTSGDNRFGPDPKGVAIGPTKAEPMTAKEEYRAAREEEAEPEAQPETQLWTYCEDCGSKVSKRLTACTHCGCPVDPKVICSDCGENFVASLAACPVCGGPAPDSSG